MAPLVALLVVGWTAALFGVARRRPARRGRVAELAVTRARQPKPDPLARLGSSLRRPLTRGRASDASLDRWLGAALVLGAPVAAAGHVLLGLLLAVAVVVQGRRARALRSRARSQAVAAALPDLVDLLSTAVGAGCTAEGALRAVELHSPDPVRPAIASAVQRLEVGATFEDAMAVLDELPAMTPVARLLVAAHFDGVPLAPSLERLGDEARRHARLQAEELARRLPVRLLLPLVLCTLPAFALLTVVPALLATLGRLR